ncbi:unnamed protein product [Sphenostylis stenocarpa]|uniref:Uncharacterized protein n=1 Tax=Sphenostylis stenocarpa TaxID=92480 RepID=A0AA86STP0_9FABA|nr:unnamed protein product [Sphenostylis stenocarpa]
MARPPVSSDRVETAVSSNETAVSFFTENETGVWVNETDVSFFVGNETGVWVNETAVWVFVGNETGVSLDETAVSLATRDETAVWVIQKAVSSLRGEKTYFLTRKTFLSWYGSLIVSPSGLLGFSRLQIGGLLTLFGARARFGVYSCPPFTRPVDCWPSVVRMIDWGVKELTLLPGCLSDVPSCGG